MSQLTALLKRCRDAAGKAGDTALVLDIEKMIRTYTVTLGYPTHVCESGRSEIYTWAGEADGPTQAYELAVDAMIAENGGDECEFGRDEIAQLACDSGDLTC